VTAIGPTLDEPTERGLDDAGAPRKVACGAAVGVAAGAVDVGTAKIDKTFSIV
jgi:hypothetical protein